MRIKIQQFLGQNAHSWSVTGRSIGRELIKLGHDVEFISTNGLDGFPEDLKPWLKNEPTGLYDLQFAFTALKNFPAYLAHGNSNRIGMWSYESSVLPVGFSKFYTYADKLVGYSQYCKDVFVKNNIPENHVDIIPLGYDVDAFKTDDKYPLKTKKSRKILVNCVQNHIRKGIPLIFEAFGKAFTKDDDVCLVFKTVIKKVRDNCFEPVKNVSGNRAIRKQQEKINQKNSDKKVDTDQQFEVDFYKIYNNFCKKYPNHAEVEIITEFLPNIATIYNSCDIVFQMSHAECWWLPGIEGMAKNKITIAPNFGGQLDFMNESNSLLISGKIIRAPKELQYWTSSPYAEVFQADINEAAEKLRYAYENYNMLLEKFKPEMKITVEKFTWKNSALKLLSLCE
jgi:glycosyltransferase involved in cell wall biosynthesis